MRGPHVLPYLLLLPLGACLPLLDRSGSADAMDGMGATESWGDAMDGIGARESWGNATDGFGASESWGNATEGIGAGESKGNAMDGIGDSEIAVYALDLIRAGGSWWNNIDGNKAAEGWRSVVDGMGAAEGWRNAIDGMGASESLDLLAEGRSPPFVGRLSPSARALYQAMVDLSKEIRALKREDEDDYLSGQNLIRSSYVQSIIDTKPPMDPLDHILTDKHPKRKEASFKVGYGQ